MKNLTLKVIFGFFVLGGGCFFLSPNNHALKWQEENGFRWAELSVPESGKPGFATLPAAETGVAFENRIQKEQLAGNRFLLGGSGVAAGDIDGDGLIDLYFCRMDGPNALYKNLGDWRFEDVTEKAGVACPDRFSTGTTFADLDGDGDLDLLVNALGGPNACFFNDGKGVFTEVTEQVGLTADKGSTSMALADIEGDGDLDIYVTNFKKRSVESLFPPAERAPHLVAQKIGKEYQIAPKFEGHYRVEMVDGQPTLFENPDTDFLYLNNGDGVFEEVSFEEGRFKNEAFEQMTPPKDWGLQPTFRDMDNDGDPDIFVCNDYWSPDRIWINDGDGRFHAIPKNAIRHTSRFTMAVDFSDINRDGHEDFYLIDMLARNHERRMQQMSPAENTPNSGGRPQLKRNTLFLNRGDQTYAEIGQYSGVEASEWTWTARFLDVDLDGYEDILTTNGQLHDFEDVDTNNRVQQLSAFGYDYRRLTTLYPDYLTPNVAFRNKRDLTFEDVSAEWGFTEPDVAWGLALADFDNDGDLDLATNRLDMSAGIYRNESPASRIAVRLRGADGNTQGVGAKVRVVGGPVVQQKEVIVGGTYLSGSDPLLVFAAGESDSLTIEVTWRNGKTSLVPRAQPNRIYEIFDSGAVEAKHSGDAATTTPFFVEERRFDLDAPDENDENEFRKQPLLPKQISNPGTSAAWLDLDGDSNVDLIFGRGGRGAPIVFRNRGQSVFSAPSKTASSKDFYHNLAAQTHKFFKGEEQARVVVFADYDGDGDLDVFVGGGAVSGRYPESEPSFFLKNANGVLKTDEENLGAGENFGLVTSAVFSDMDDDGDPDLILAVEWGAIRILQNQDGKFIETTEKWGMENYTGMWQGVTTGDLNADGKPDIIAANWGVNTAYKANPEHPRYLFYGDFDSNGVFDLIEAHTDSATGKVVPDGSFTELTRAIPIVGSRMRNNQNYAASSVEEILGSVYKRAKRLSVNTAASMVFLNRGDHFEAVAMPPEAQFTVANAANVADFDGDGHDDVFLSQNLLSTRRESDRQDGGRGLWLRGDGTGGLEAVSGQTSGIKIYGEQNGAALGDFNADGRVDLIVAQKNAPAVLYRNTLAKQGIRVKLNGIAGNPEAVGAVIRIIYQNGDMGPAREIQAAAGRLSRGAFVQLLGLRSQPKTLWIRWPNGKIQETPIANDAKEIVVGMQ